MSMRNTSGVGGAIRAQRVARGWSADRLSREALRVDPGLKLSSSAVLKAEKGDLELADGKLAAISRALNVEQWSLQRSPEIPVVSTLELVTGKTVAQPGERRHIVFDGPVEGKVAWRAPVGNSGAGVWPGDLIVVDRRQTCSCTLYVVLTDDCRARVRTKVSENDILVGSVVELRRFMKTGN